jgi:hypothetical protein
MNKQEATSLLKELLAKCKLDSDSFILMEPNPKDRLSTGYKIRVKTVLNNECRCQIREITKRYDLAVIEEQTQIIVYKPQLKPSGNLIL